MSPEGLSRIDCAAVFSYGLSLARAVFRMGDARGQDAFVALPKAT